LTVSEEANLMVAKLRVEEIKAFYVHAGIFVGVNAALFFINWMTHDDGWWAQWALLGWGIGLAIHAFSVFGPRSQAMMAWEKRKLAQLMSKN
jgi:uncharacterized membrane protein